MNNKTIIFIISLIILILSLNTFSAHSLNDTDVRTAEVKSLDKNAYSHDEKQEKSDIIYVNSGSDAEVEDGTDKYPYKTITNETLCDISPDSTIMLSRGTYRINSLNITKNLNIIGESRQSVIVVSDDEGSIFNNINATVVLKNFTIRNHISESGAAIINNGYLLMENICMDHNSGTTKASRGGGILNNGELLIRNSTFENNSASWGAAVYNTNSTIVYNSKFKDNNIYNVGGALYNLRGNLMVYDSRFSGNRAVSGAAIYNAKGHLYVNNTEFYKNDAEKFFGGAIYSTGNTITNNSQFYLNHATKDGGAITNTNNFTIINCLFEQNSAEENGGTIENVPWSITENGNLTIINSSFIENSAGNDGGVIINYNKEDAVGEFCTVTARNCIFDSNTASRGGVIYNQQYMDFQYSIFTNNRADESDIIYSDSKLIKSIENNWWSTNNPTKNSIGAMPKTWITMKYTNTTAMVTNMTTRMSISLDTLNNGEKLNSTLPERTLIFTAQKTQFPDNYISIKDNYSTTITPQDTITVQIDNQKLSLKPVKANITYSLTNNNQTMNVKIQFPSNVNAKTSIKINSKTIAKKITLTKGKAELNYGIPLHWSSSKYNLGVVMLTADGMSFKDNNTIIKIPQRKVTAALSVINATGIKAGTSIKLKATVKLSGKYVSTGRVTFKINNRSIKSNVKIVNGNAVITYRIPSSFTPKKYLLSTVYSGDGNKASAVANKSITLAKQNVHTTFSDKIRLSSNTRKKYSIKLLDENNRSVTTGKACYKINGKTLKTNISVVRGVFNITVDTSEYPNKNSLTLTLKYGENSKYASLIRKVSILIK